MEIKKSDKANLENKKLLFTELGLIVSLAITFGAFEYTSKETKVSTLEDTAEVVLEEEIIPITQETPPPPPAAPKIPILSGSSFFTALNNGLISAAMSFIRTLVFQLAAVLVLPIVWTPAIDGIWFSVVVAEFSAAALTVSFIIANKKKYVY